MSPNKQPQLNFGRKACPREMFSAQRISEMCSNPTITAAKVGKVAAGLRLRSRHFKVDHRGTFARRLYARAAETERLVWPFKAEALRRALDGDSSLLNKITELEAEQGWMNQMMGRGFGLYGQVSLDPICSPSDPIKKAPCKD